jgi:NAD(P)-dependent dehydrogenase (short-subunit alcohol dehydrogenase family)
MGLCVVTGATSGIGLATAVGLARAGRTVVLCGRNPTRLEAAVAKVQAESSAPHRTVVCDMASLADVRRAAAELASLERIDVLVNNAGVLKHERSVTVDGYEETFAVNHLAPFLLTTLLLDKLAASAPARVVNVSSVVHRGARIRWDELQSTRRYTGLRAYAQSKLANLLFTRELARRMEGRGVTANALHPGGVRTELPADEKGLFAFAFRLAGPLLRSPERGARTSIWLATSPEVAGVTGRYFVDCKERRPGRAALDDEAARRLWAVSEELVAPGARGQS